MRSRRVRFSPGALRARAASTLPRYLMDYLEGGSDDEKLLAGNELAFQEWYLVPRAGEEVIGPDLSTTVLGEVQRTPLILAPCGFINLVCRDGAVSAARIAGERGLISCVSKISLAAPEAVAAVAPGRLWYHINFAGGRTAVENHLEMASRARYQALLLTVDGPPPGHREREIVNGLTPPVSVTPALLGRIALQALSRPRWSITMLPEALAAIQGRATSASRASGVLRAGDLSAGRLTWEDVAWIRQRWPGPLVLKGLLHPESARRARDHGADAIVVSNHGGRQLDAAPPSLAVLPAIVEALDGSIDVLFDGGVRRASDVVKALCLGADAVMIGRPYLYALASGGAAELGLYLDHLVHELTRTLTLLGCGRVSDLDRSWLQANWSAGPTGRSTPLPEAALPQPAPGVASGAVGGVR